MTEWTAYVFDLDGTLIDSTSTLLAGLHHALSPLHIEVSEKLIEDIRGNTGNNLFSTLNLSTEDELLAFARLRDFYVENFRTIPLFPRIEELLQLLYSHGKRLALWTARDTFSAEQILQALNIAQYFEFIVGHTQFERNKPYPDGLRYIVEQMHLSPQDVVMIGDHDHDIQGARTLGCHSIRVHWGETTVQPEEEADYNFYTVDQFIQHLKED